MSELVIQPERRLTAAEFQHLAAVPALVEWFANIDKPTTADTVEAHSTLSFAAANKRSSS